jgi:hypothetical protein
LETIRAQRPAIFAELLRKWSARLGYHPNAVIELLRSAGYRCFACHGSRLAEIEGIDDATLDTNFFFLHDERHRADIARLA